MDEQHETCWCGMKLISIYVGGVPHSECPIHATAYGDDASRLPDEEIPQ